MEELALEHIALLFYVPYMVIKVHAAIDYIATKTGHESILAVAQQWCYNSPRNLWDMKKFYLRYNEEDTKLRQAVALLPWSHNLLLMTYNLSPDSILFRGKKSDDVGQI